MFSGSYTGKWRVIGRILGTLSVLFCNGGAWRVVAAENREMMHLFGEGERYSHGDFFLVYWGELMARFAISRDGEVTSEDVSR